MSNHECRIQVRIRPNAPVSESAGKQGAFYKFEVAAPAKEGKANRELIILLSDLLDLPKSQIRIQAGERTRTKLIHIEGRSLPEVQTMLMPE